MDKFRADLFDKILDHFFKDGALDKLNLSDNSRFNNDLALLVKLGYLEPIELEEDDEYHELFITPLGEKFLLLGGFTKKQEEDFRKKTN